MECLGSFNFSNKMPRKRKGSAFKGNRYMKVKCIDGKRVCVPSDTTVTTVTVSESQQNDTRDRAESTVTVVASKCSDHENATPTRSKIKIEELYKLMQDSDSDSSDDERDDEVLDVDSEVCEGNRLIDVGVLKCSIESQLICRFGRSTVQLLELKQQGLASEFVFHCDNVKCNRQDSFSSCERIAVGNLTVCSVNRQAALAMRCIGGSRADLRTFCGVMDMPPPVRGSSYNKINKTIQKAACAVQKKQYDKGS